MIVKRFYVGGMALAAIAAIAVVWTLARGHRADAANVPAKARPVPVMVAQATAQDVPIILRGLGAVQAFNSVAIQSRVEGAITRINFKEGQVVHAGDVLIELDARPYEATLKQAEAQRAKDEAALANAQADLQRYGDLLKRNFTPEQQYATQQATVSQDEAALKADDATIQAAQLNVNYAQIKSPIDGVTGIRQVDLGNLIQANSTQTLVTVTQVQPIYVTFSLAEADVERIRAAMRQGTLTVDAYAADDRRKIASGTLNLVDNMVDQTTGTFKLKAQFANGDEALWPGQFVNAHLLVETVKNGVTVPAGAVQTGPKGTYAYVVKDDSTVDMRPITVTQTEATQALIGKGLNAGDKVVTAGMYRLSQGTKVEIADHVAATALLTPAGSAP